MPRPSLNLPELIANLPSSAVALHAESGVPIEHYKRLSNDAWAALQYFQRKVQEAKYYQAGWDRHFGSLHRMVLLSLVESFERFLKELAAVCADEVAHLVVDARLDKITAGGSAFAHHFAPGTIGKALCDSLTWLKTSEVNDRYRALLADPFQPGEFYLFPKKGQQPVSLLNLDPTMSLIFQVRHILVHNAGVMTESDALKIRLLAKRSLAAPRLLQPTYDDLRYAKRLLDEAADLINNAVKDRLQELLTTLLQSDSTLFNPAIRAQHIADTFQLRVRPKTLMLFVREGR